MHVLTNIKQNTFTILLYPIFWECFGHMHSVINPINSKIIWIAKDHCWLLIYFLVTKYKNAILYHQSFYLDTKISSFFNFHGWEHCRWIQIPKNAHQLWLPAFLLKKFAITFDTIQSHSVEMYYFSSKKWAKILQEKGGACFSSRRRSGLNL